MIMIGNIVIGLIAFLHIYIMVVEMFLWNKPFGIRSFKLDKDFAESTRVLAANQGLYNGFLAAGLIFSLWTSYDPVKLFFMICIFLAGLFGGFSSSKKIIVIQSVPALIGIILVLLHI